MNTTPSHPETAVAYRHLLAAKERLPGHGFYVLIDPQISDPLPSAAVRDQAVAIPLRARDVLPEQRPFLYPLGDFGRDLVIDAMIEVAVSQAKRQYDEREGRSVCGWIASAVPAEELAQHLARCSVLPHVRDVTLFRHWDPRVLDLLSGLLRADQARTLLGPASASYWLDRKAQVCGLYASHTDAHVEQGALQFDITQLDALRRAEDLNRCLDVLQDMGHDATQPELRQRILRLIERGSSAWGLPFDWERMTYVMYGVLVDEDFDSDPTVLRTMRGAQAQGVSVIHALDDFDDAFWDRVRDNARQGPPTNHRVAVKERHHG